MRITLACHSECNEESLPARAFMEPSLSEILSAPADLLRRTVVLIISGFLQNDNSKRLRVINCCRSEEVQIAL
jgi:hypothetical protein